MLSSVSAYGDRYHGDIDGALSLTMARSARRGPWLPEEDQELLQLVRTQGANNWVRISHQLQHRSPKQCRERYHQNLKPSLKHDPISVQEGEVIERLVQEMGKRWAEIARRLGNRSDNAVKNWWNGSVNRRRRNPAQATTGFKQVGSRPHPMPFTLPTEHSHTQRARPLVESKTDAGLPSHEIQQSIPQQHGSASLQTLSPVHITTSSTIRTSPTTPYGSHLMLSMQPVSTSGPTSAISRPLLSKVQTSDLRPELPPLRSASFHLQYNDRRNLGMDRPPISPALSDTSQKHAPSLVSDNQSMYSISPRTVTSPRPGKAALADIGHTSWSGIHTGGQPSSQGALYKSSYQSESYSKYDSHIPFDPVLQRLPIQNTNSDKSKDLRMNVSTLLQ